MKRFSFVGRALVRLWRAPGGAATVEVALALPLLITLGLATVTLGDTIIHSMQLTNAVRSGAQYAVVRKPVGGDVSDIIAAVKHTAPADTTGTRTVTAQMFCRCPDGTPLACSDSCSDGSDRQAYITIRLKETYPRLLDLPGLSKDVALSREATVRLN